MESWDADEMRQILNEIANMAMPFGQFGPEKYPPHGVPIYDLPIEYLAWWEMRGFPKGKLGKLMKIVYETRAAGMDSLFDPIRQRKGGRFKFRKPARKNWEF